MGDMAQALQAALGRPVSH